jgi:hypothetical protein
MLKLLFLYKSNIPNVPMDSTNDYRSALVDEIGKLCEVKRWGPGFDLYDDNIWDISDIINILYGNDIPDVIFYYFLNGHIVKYINFDKLKNIKKIILRIDPRYTHCAVFNPKNPNTPNIMFVNQYIENNKIDLVLGDMDNQFNAYPITDNIEYQLFPRCADSNIFKQSNWEKKDIDITLCGAMADYYPLRKIILEKLIKPKYRNLKIFIAPGRRSGSNTYPDPRITYKDQIKEINDKIKIKYSVDHIITNLGYSKLLQRSKIVIFCSSKYKYPLFKSVEIMLCQTVAAFDKHNNLSDYGYNQYVNYIDINRNYWMSNINFFLKNTIQLNQIAINGYNLAIKNHTYKVRAKQLVDYLTNKTDKIYKLEK